MKTMLKGQNIYLRTITDKDIKEFLELNDDLSLRGDYFPIDILTEKNFHKWYNENSVEVSKLCLQNTFVSSRTLDQQKVCNFKIIE
jgi:hypothetical protein